MTLRTNWRGKPYLSAAASANSRGDDADISAAGSAAGAVPAPTAGAPSIDPGAAPTAGAAATGAAYASASNPRTAVEASSTTPVPWYSRIVEDPASWRST